MVQPPWSHTYIFTMKTLSHSTTYYIQLFECIRSSANTKRWSNWCCPICSVWWSECSSWFWRTEYILYCNPLPQGPDGSTRQTFPLSLRATQVSYLWRVLSRRVGTGRQLDWLLVRYSEPGELIRYMFWFQFNFMKKYFWLDYRFSTWWLKSLRVW